RLTGHSARVAKLSGHMAEHLGLSPQQVTDTRMAGMLHDVGQTTLPTRLVRSLDLTDPTTSRDYAAAGARILGDLTFLSGALDPIRGHRNGFDGAARTMPPTRIVAIADRYDLLTRVGDPGGAVCAPTRARQLLMTDAADAMELIQALDDALARGISEEGAE
ncbi:MAG: HD-GYP domain-containing protein, partial [Angustibacter sp.]